MENVSLDREADGTGKKEEHHVTDTDGCKVEVEINPNDYHDTEIMLKNEVNIKQKHEEDDHWPQVGVFLMREEKNYCSESSDSSEDEQLREQVMEMRETEPKEIESNKVNGEEGGAKIKIEPIEEVENEEDYICCRCGEKRLTKEELRDHFYREHLSLLVNNQGGTNKEMNHKCTVCYKVFETAYKLRQHFRYHSEKRFQCNICEYTSRHRSNLRKHINRHTGEKPYKCNLCEFSSACRSSLRTHIIRHTGEKPFKCNLCEYSASSSSNLKAHILIHTGEKPYKCSSCECSFLTNTHLSRHMVIHTGEKLYKCDLCENSFSTGSYLRVHKLCHTGEKPFKCDLCEFRCSRSSNLRRHMFSHTGEKPFNCDLCEFRCSSSSSLRAHMLRHSKEKPFKCNLCDYGCKSRRTLKIHMLKHAD